MDMLKPFDSLSSWWSCVRSAGINLVRGVSLLLKALLLGITSLFLAVWRRMSRWVGGNPSIALGGFLVTVFLAWLITFMAMRARAVGAEAQRDSLAWQYSEFKERHGYEE